MKCKQKQDEWDKYLTLTEVSEMLKVHPNTLRNWDANGTLKAIRIGVKRIRRYSKSEIDEYLAKNNK